MTPLHRTLYHDTKNKVPFTPATATVQEPPGSAHFMAPDTDEYEAGLTVIGEFDTVETFCRYFNWLKPPSKLERNSNYHIFKSGIKPMWEDEANANGGKWVLTMKNNPQLLDRCWSWLAMALVGEDLDEGDEICGAVVSLRSKVDRIQVWTRSKEDVEKINGIARKMVKLLDVSEADGIGLEFQVSSLCSCIHVFAHAHRTRRTSITTKSDPQRISSSPSRPCRSPLSAPLSQASRLGSTAPSPARERARRSAALPAQALVVRSPASVSEVVASLAQDGEASVRHEHASVPVLLQFVVVGTCGVDVRKWKGSSRSGCVLCRSGRQ